MLGRQGLEAFLGNAEELLTGPFISQNLGETAPMPEKRGRQSKQLGRLTARSVVVKIIRLLGTE